MFQVNISRSPANATDTFTEHDITHTFFDQVINFMATPMKLFKSLSSKLLSSEVKVPTFPVAIASVKQTSTPYAFALFEDSKLRVYNVDTHKHILELPLRENVGLDQSRYLSRPYPKSFIKTFPVKVGAGTDNLATVKLAVILPSRDAGDFEIAFCSGSTALDGKAGSLRLTETVVLPLSPDAVVVDCSILPISGVLNEEYLLWVLTETGGTYHFKYLKIRFDGDAPVFDKNTLARWQHVSTGKLPSFQECFTEDITADLDEEFIRNILLPGRFSLRVISQALSHYREQNGFPLLKVKLLIPNLPRLYRLRHLLLEAINAQSLQPPSPRRANGLPDILFNQPRKRLEMKRFWGICEELFIAEKLPVGLFTCKHSGSVFAIRRGCLSVYRQSSTVEIIQRLKAQDMPREYFECCKVSLMPFEGQKTSITMKASRRARLPRFSTNCLFFLLKAPKHLNCTIDFFLNTLPQEKVSLAQHLVYGFDVEVLDHLLDLVALQGSETQDSDASKSPSEFLKTSFILSFIQVAYDRQEASKDIMLLVAMGMFFDKSYVNENTLRRALVTFHTCSIHSWLGEFDACFVFMDRELYASALGLLSLLPKGFAVEYLTADWQNANIYWKKALVRFARDGVSSQYREEAALVLPPNIVTCLMKMNDCNAYPLFAEFADMAISEIHARKDILNKEPKITLFWKQKCFGIACEALLDIPPKEE
ncbi:nucleoporin Nup120/160-domain-containing protein [Chytridium lagenaria]|nr:nucleoporin Nup120/160-domain-containing protein [Chytridium lagenaria]